MSILDLIRRQISRIAVSLKFLVALTAALSLPPWVFATDWPTYGHDPQRSGWAVDESTLTPENVSKLTLKWKAHLKNEPLSLTALTAPLVADHVNTAQGPKTVVYVAGSSNHLFALDAAGGNVIWSRDFETHVLLKDETMWLCPNNLNDTPAIDRSTGTIYVIASDGKLWGLDLSSGETKFGPIEFVPPFSKNWSLNLHGSTVYTSISQGCGGAQSGIYAMNLRDPRRPVIRDLLVANQGAGIWGRGGPVIGLNDRIYAATGDGPFDPAAGDYASSFIAASLSSLKVLDYYAPEDYQHLTHFDLDLGSTSAVWFAAGDHNLVAGGGKGGVLYLLDADALGSKDHHTAHYIAKLANDPEEFQAKGIWGALAVWRDETGTTWLYVPIYGPVSTRAPKAPITNGPTPHGSILAFKVARDQASKQPTLVPAWVSRDFDVPDPPVLANGVLFALSTGENPLQTTGTKVIYSGQKLLTDQERAANTHNAELYALDAKTGKFLYRSGDAMSTWVHFSGLAVANGQIYAVDHDSNLYCFGLKQQP
jgi:outer membrane protein assembly factor BamB